MVYQCVFPGNDGTFPLAASFPPEGRTGGKKRNVAGGKSVKDVCPNLSLIHILEERSWIWKTFWWVIFCCHWDRWYTFCSAWPGMGGDGRTLRRRQMQEKVWSSITAVSYTHLEKDFNQRAGQILTMLAAECSRQFERLPILLSLIHILKKFLQPMKFFQCMPLGQSRV